MNEPVDNFINFEDQSLDNEDEKAVQNQKIIIISADDPPKTKWSVDAMQLMLKILKSKVNQFETGEIRRKKMVWEQTANDMTKLGYPRNVAQIRSKWHDFRKTHRNRILKKKKKVIGTKRFFLFEKEVAEIYSKLEKFTSDDSSVVGDNLLDAQEESIDNSDEDDDDIDIHPMNIEASSSSSLKDEMMDLKGAVADQNASLCTMQKRMLEMQHKVLQNVIRMQEKTDQMIKFQARHLKIMEEQLEQTKIQNSLMQKLLERL